MTDAHVLVSLPIVVGDGEPVPKSVSLRDIRLKFHGEPTGDLARDFFWGAHGNNSREVVLYSLTAALPSARIIRVDVEYRVLERSRGRATHADFANGDADCLRTDRIAPSFAGELRERWVEQLKCTKGVRLTETEIEAMSLDDLSCAYPKLTMSLFKDYPQLKAISVMVHTKTPGIDDPTKSPRARVAVCRVDPDRIISAGVRFMPEVDVRL